MKQRIIIVLLIAIFFSLKSYSQVEFKTEYLAPRRYENNQKEKTSGYGSSITSSLAARQLVGVIIRHPSFGF